MIDYVRFCGIIIIVSLVVGACKAMDNPTSLGVWLAKDTGNRPPVRNLMISHWNFHWVLAFAWILHGFPAMYEYVFDYWRVYQNDTSLHWFRLLPWKFVSTQRPAIWQQTVTCEFHPTKSTNNGESAITYIYIYNYYIHIYILYILSLMFWSTNRRTFHQRQRDDVALPCFAHNLKGKRQLCDVFLLCLHFCWAT